MGLGRKITAGVAGVAALGGSYLIGESRGAEDLTPIQHKDRAIELANASCREDVQEQLGNFALDQSLTVAENQEAMNKTISEGMIGCVADRTGLTESYVKTQELVSPVAVIVNGQVSLGN